MFCAAVINAAQIFAGPGTALLKGELPAENGVPANGYTLSWLALSGWVRCVVYSSYSTH